MGGLGKTTLAHTIFNDGVTKEHFDIKVRMFASQILSGKTNDGKNVEKLERYCWCRSSKR